MIWIYLSGTVLLSWVTLICLGVSLINIQFFWKDDPKDTMPRKWISLLFFGLFVAIGSGTIWSWLYIYTSDPTIIRSYFGIWIAAYLVRILTIGLHGDLGYLVGGNFEPDWEDIWLSLFLATTGPFVLIGLFLELSRRWFIYTKNRRK